MTSTGRTLTLPLRKSVSFGRALLAAIVLIMLSAAGAPGAPQDVRQRSARASTRTMAIDRKSAEQGVQLYSTWKEEGFIAAGKWLVWERDSSSRHSEMIVTTDSDDDTWLGEGDIDLYVREDHPPTFDEWDFISDDAYDSDEEIIIDNETDPQMHEDNWWIGIYAWEDTYYEVKVKLRSDPLYVEGWTIPYTTLEFSDLATVTAEYDGYYTYDFVPYNWTGTITPAHPGYTFDPPNLSYRRLRFNLTEQNFSGYTPFLRLTGWTNDANTQLVLLNADGSRLAELTASPFGFYSYDAVPFGWTGSIRPSQPGVVFDPLQRDYDKLELNLDDQNFNAALLPAGMVSGTVLDIDSGSPFAGATVHLRNRNGSSQVQQTNSLGEFNFPDVRPGEYYLLVKSLGFTAQRWPRHGFFTLASSSSVSVLNILLKPPRTASRHWNLYR